MSLVLLNDVSLLFTQLDENGDGSININELWKKSAVYKPEPASPCLLTDLLPHEDSNEDDFLDFTEFQNAFNKLYTAITMVTLEQSLAVNTIQAHIGDNVEIRCDIIGKPQQPVIKWFRHNVDLTSVNVPNLKWSAIGGLAAVDCRYESLDSDVKVKWYKNDELISANQKITIMHNETRIEIGQLTRSDTGAYACRVQNEADSAMGQDIASLLVQ
ncbi:follistatin-related protein 5-like protein, partial [Dinothrombium tinctorium]